MTLHSPKNFIFRLILETAGAGKAANIDRPQGYGKWKARARRIRFNFGFGRHGLFF